MKVAELRKLCRFHNLRIKDSNGKLVEKCLLITYLKSFAAGDYVHIPDKEPEPEKSIDELIVEMEKEFETYEMNLSEREGAYYHAGFVGKSDPNLTKVYFSY